MNEAVKGKAQADGLLRRIGEDKVLRPFLTAHFNATEYISDIIRQGKSEAVFADVSKFIEDVKEEIQVYITENKAHLMSGMSGVAALADRYSMLSISSQKLHRSVEKLKREALTSHDVVKKRTHEVERIHQTGSLLRQIRQFSHTHGQLNHLMDALNKVADGSSVDNQESRLIIRDDVDVRQLPTVAKVVYELESLLADPKLDRIDYLKPKREPVLKFGRNLRVVAQAKLLAALEGNDQSSVASCLQIFFNLHSLPQVVFDTIDSTVGDAIDFSKRTIDVDAIVDGFPEVMGGTGSRSGRSGGSRTAAALAAVASMGHSRGGKGPSNSTGSGGEDGSHHGGGTSKNSEVLLKASLREISALWGEGMGKFAASMRTLELVVSKKEDSSTRTRFTDCLARYGEGMGVQTRVDVQYLRSGRLLTLFFSRLSSRLADCMADKSRVNLTVSLKLYPYLRVAAQSLLSAVSSPGNDYDGSGEGTGRSEAAFEYAGESKASRNSSSASERTTAPTGVFGAMNSGASSFGAGSYLSVSATLGSFPAIKSTGSSSAFGINSGTEMSPAAPSPGSGTTLPLTVGVGDAPLVDGFRPLLEKYLSASYTKMSTPVQQMFPQLEGYTAAVPSKRDVQELMKAVSTELSASVADGGLSLLRVVCVEANKSVHLILSNIKNMVILPSNDHTLLEISSSHRAGKSKLGKGAHDGVGEGHGTGGGGATSLFSRSANQEYNLQLLMLLAQLRENLVSLPQLVGIASSSGSSSSAAAASLGVVSSAKLENEVYELVVQPACGLIDEVATTQLVSTIIECTTRYARKRLFELPLERSGPTSGGATRGEDMNDTDEAVLVGCSNAMASLQRELPSLLETFVTSLPFGDSFSKTSRADTPARRQARGLFPSTTIAIEQFFLHLMSAYISAAALVRPVDEAWRLRTARDLSALEHALARYGGDDMLSSLNMGKPDECPVYQEFRAFRRFIFREEEGAASAVSPVKQGEEVGPGHAAGAADSKKVSMSAPSLASLQSLPYFKHLRPSTVLGYIISCCPSQMPGPHEHLSEGLKAGGTGAERGRSVHSYLMKLSAVDGGDATKSGAHENMNVRALYKSGRVVQDRRGQASVATSWQAVPNEAAMWEAVHASLDVFLQRISVAEATKRVGMRLWADCLLNVGNHYFG